MQECPNCGGPVRDNETGEEIERTCPEHILDCKHVEAPHHFFCRGSCNWRFTISSCTCYPCRVGGEAECRVLARHREARESRLSRPAL